VVLVGSGGGGAGGSGSSSGISGTPNTGGGGGGAGQQAAAGGNGGSGVVIIKIPNTVNAVFSGGVTFSVSTSVPGYKIYTVTATSTTFETAAHLRFHNGTFRRTRFKFNSTKSYSN
jgi:hypothetical protein